MVAENTALTASDYVCVLKSKRGELQAIGDVVKDRFVALIEASRVEKSLSIARAWGTAEVVWIQPLNVDGLDDPDWGDEVKAMFASLDAEGVLAVPVVTLGEVPEATIELKAIVARNARGLVLRIDAEDVLTIAPKDLLGEIDDILAAYRLNPDEIDLVLDASLVRDSVAGRIATIESARRGLPYESDWRSLVVAFSAFPTQMGDVVAKNATSLVPRHDREAYLSVVARNIGGGRDVTYADFAIGQPTYADVRFRAIPNIKYTGVTDWHIHRADSVQDPSPQYISLAQDLAASPYFRGASFSAGDDYLANVASGRDGPGNATSYVHVAVSHHLNHVIDRLATHGEP